MTAIVKHQAAPVAVAQPESHADFGQIVEMGANLAKTGFLPSHIRDGFQFAAIVLTGRELGMPPMRAVRSLSMVKGKVVESADSQLARFKAAGGRAHFTELTEERAVLKLRHPNGDEHTEAFTADDARRAGLATNENYRKFPKAMLRSRAITAGLKSLGWEGAVGAYDPDEAAGFDDDAKVRWSAAPEASAPVLTVNKPVAWADHLKASDATKVRDALSSDLFAPAEAETWRLALADAAPQGKPAVRAVATEILKAKAERIAARIAKQDEAATEPRDAVALFDAADAADDTPF